MKETEIIEVLPDGTVYHFDMEVCNSEADRALSALWEMEDNKLGFDYTATVYSLFVRAVMTLSQSGWQTDELLEAVLMHSQADDEDDDLDDEDDDLDD